MTTTSTDMPSTAEKDRQREEIAADIAFFLRKPRNKIHVLPGFGERSRSDTSIQGSKNRAFA